MGEYCTHLDESAREERDEIRKFLNVMVRRANGDVVDNSVASERKDSQEKKDGKEKKDTNEEARADKERPDKATERKEKKKEHRSEKDRKKQKSDSSGGG